MVLDGELVCLAADGKPDFAALRRRLIARGNNAAARAAAAEQRAAAGEAGIELPPVVAWAPSDAA